LFGDEQVSKKVSYFPSFYYSGLLFDLRVVVHKDLEEIFSEGELLSQHLDGDEQWQEQQSMALQIAQAYVQDQIALVEAGTGIGKSLTYLAPAILWAVHKKERTVISTHTIALQEQLIEKEIPFLLKVLGVDLKATLVKGMGNYLCLKKYSELE